MNSAPRKHAHNPISKVALSGLALGVISIVTATISVVGYRLNWWRHLEAFSIFEWATYAASIALLLSAYGSLKVRSPDKQPALLLGIMGILLSLPVITATLLFEYSAKAYPPINDITTDTQDPPSFWDVPNPINYPGKAVADLQQTAYPDLSPLQLSISPEQTFDQALTIIKDEGWEVIATDPDEGRIEATESSLLFGFKDEMVVRIGSYDDGAIVDIRSRSRIGRIDRGTNAKRIRGYLKDLKVRTDTL